MNGNVDSIDIGEPSPQRNKNNYWKYGFFIILFLMFLSNGFLFYKETINVSRTKPATDQNLTREKIIKVYPTESPSDLEARCGDIPMSILTSKGHYDVMNGPAWSPDCRHIAWSLWESGTSYLGDDPEILKEIEKSPPRQPTGREGVFILTDSNQVIQKIYVPKQLNETPVFIRWEDKDTILFRANHIEYKYSIQSKELTIISNSITPSVSP